LILVDTSVWVDHLRTGNSDLAAALEDGIVSVHPMVIGELACGNLRNRREILDSLQSLPIAPLASHNEVLFLIESHRLMGQGLGYVDMHLLASVVLEPGAQIWTSDRRLRNAAGDMGVLRAL
jgi:predicted nucleic acid-binding protein